jgi:RNA polymerase sigma-70 factor (ECF subfamily)
VTLTWIEANGHACVLVSRDGNVGALVTVHASAQGIDQLMGMMRPSKLAAVSRSLPDPVGG